MKKRSLYILLSVFFLLIVAVFCLFQSRRTQINEYRYSSLRNGDLEQLKEGRKESELFVDEIFFNGVPLIYDKQSRCYYYSLSEENSAAADPLISWDSQSVRIAFADKQISKELIAADERIEMVLYDKDRYLSTQLVCTTLPLIDIEKLYDELHFEYDDCSITVLDNSAGTFNTYDGRVRIRGGELTSEMPKPGLRIKLDKVLKGDNNRSEKYYEILGLEPDNEFVLYTSNIEKDHIRNVFTTNLWYDTCADDNALGMKLGMSYRYCEVFVNGHYWGLCAIGNPISEKRNYVELDPSSAVYPRENIYKMNFFGDREKMDYEKYGKDYFFALKTNEDIPQAWKPFSDYTKLLLYSDDKEELYASIDIDNALDIYLFYNMTQAWDNAWFEDNLKFRNTYLISKVQADGSIRMFYIPWDLDRCWGHEREDGLEFPMDYTRNYPMVMIPIENLLNMNDPEIKTLLREKYQFLRKESWSDENIMKMLEKYEEQAYGSGAFKRDSARWPQNYHSSSNDLHDFKEYVLNRIHYFDGYVDREFS